MKLSDRLRQLELEEMAAEKRANEKKTREEKARREEREVEEARYIGDNLTQFLETLGNVIVSKWKDGKLVLDEKQRWLYQSPIAEFRYSLFLEKALERIREWAITEGLRVITEPRVEIDRDYDRDHEGGAVNGTDRPIYGPRITFEWKGYLG